MLRARSKRIMNIPWLYSLPVKQEHYALMLLVAEESTS